MIDNQPGPMLQVESATMSFGPGPPAIDRIGLSVAAGEFVALVGPSGCGKSTLLRLIAGLLHPTSGRIDAGGRRVAFVFQEPTLLPWRSVVGNIRLPLELAGVARAEQQQRVDDSLRLVGLDPRDAAKRPRMLSGGMRMRVSLARALITEPDLLLLDEPFAALDDILRRQLNEELLRIWTARRFTAVFVTHNVQEAVFLSERVLVMSRSPGRIVGEIAVPFSYPRAAELRADPAFAGLTGEVSGALTETAG